MQMCFYRLGDQIQFNGFKAIVVLSNLVDTLLNK